MKVTNKVNGRHECQRYYRKSAARKGKSRMHNNWKKCAGNDLNRTEVRKHA